LRINKLIRNHLQFFSFEYHPRQTPGGGQGWLSWVAQRNDGKAGRPGLGGLFNTAPTGTSFEKIHIEKWLLIRGDEFSSG
jgi:hypothetical protein